MANNNSAKKSIRQTEKRREINRFFGKTTRNLIRDLRAAATKKEAEELLPKVLGMVDKQVRRNQFHKNKAANLKSKLTKFVSAIEK